MLCQQRGEKLIKLSEMSTGEHLAFLQSCLKREKKALADTIKEKQDMESDLENYRSELIETMTQRDQFKNTLKLKQSKIVDLESKLKASTNTQISQDQSVKVVHLATELELRTTQQQLQLVHRQNNLLSERLNRNAIQLQSVLQKQKQLQYELKTNAQSVISIQLSQLNQRISFLQKQLNEKNSLIKDLKKQIELKEAVSRQINDLDSTVREYEVVFHTMKAEAETKERICQVRQNQIRLLTAQCQKYQKQASFAQKMEQDYNNAKTAQDRLERDLRVCQTELGHAFENIKILENQKKSQQERLSHKTERINSLESELNGERNQIDELRQKLSNLSYSYQQLRTSHEELFSQFTMLEIECQHQKTFNRDFEQAVGFLNQQVFTLKEALKDKESSFYDLKIRSSDEITRLSTHLEQAHLKVGDLETQLHRLQHELAVYSDRAEVTSNEYQQIRLCYVRMEEKYQKTTEQLTTCQVRLNQVSSQLTQCNLNIKKKNAELEVERKRCQQTVNDLKLMRSETAYLQSELKKAISIQNVMKRLQKTQKQIDQIEDTFRSLRQQLSDLLKLTELSIDDTVRIYNKLGEYQHSAQKVPILYNQIQRLASTLRQRDFQQSVGSLDTYHAFEKTF